jgi:hypothetical protein
MCDAAGDNYSTKKKSSARRCVRNPPLGRGDQWVSIPTGEADRNCPSPSGIPLDEGASSRDGTSPATHELPTTPTEWLLHLVGRGLLPSGLRLGAALRFSYAEGAAATPPIGVVGTPLPSPLEIIARICVLRCVAGARVG